MNQVEQINIEDFIAEKHNYFIVDVRSEAEFAQGHIVDSVNIPVLKNEERKIVGTLYKQKGNQEAVIKGFELAGPKFFEMIRNVKSGSEGKPVMVYCWRGGMRSEIFSWILKIAGIEVYRIKGGYKKYRRLTISVLKNPYKLILVSGVTGCGKTALLRKMAGNGFQVLDIEDLANHKGSVFGNIGLPEQPTVEHFENLMAGVLLQMDPRKPVWIENENQLIGKVIIPNEFKDLMNNSPMVNISLDPEKRYRNILAEYGNLPVEALTEATSKLEKRLGNLRMRQALDAIANRIPEIWIPILMEYYDKGYNFTLDKLRKNMLLDMDISEMEESEIFSRFKKFEEGVNVW